MYSSEAKLLHVSVLLCNLYMEVPTSQYVTVTITAWKELIAIIEMDILNSLALQFKMYAAFIEQNIRREVSKQDKQKIVL